MIRTIDDIDLSLDDAQAVGVICNFIVDQFHKKGFYAAVIGLSGGLDSALGVAVAAEALGPRHVTALAMPSAESSKASLEDARLVAKQCGVRLLVEPIDAMEHALFDGTTGVDRVRIGNAAARFRMIRLFDHSHRHHALVIGTSNKTELLLGYGTWYGDLASAVNPIGDLFKTQVREMASFLALPQRIIDKPPSADLWPGQTDEGEIGYDYETIDKLLYLLVDREFSLEATLGVGFKETMVRDIIRRVTASQFKRSLPAIPKISLKTVGIDFHLARDWGH
ncbi:MAG TPA: NAD+ synthase [candidate division Zixibacteria bacterium]|jgi:NAD+ synthase